MSGLRILGAIAFIFFIMGQSTIAQTWFADVATAYVVGISFAENTEDSKKIFTVTENALVKKYDNAGWALTGLAFTGSGII